MKFFQYTLLTLIGFFCGALSLHGQGSVSGTVTDPGGEPAIGVSVSVVGTRLGAVTDLNGQYTIGNVPAGPQTLRMAYTGYQELTLPVTVIAGQTARLDFTMQENASLLDEVVVLGYDVQRRREIVGSVTKISSEKLNEIPGGSFENALQGKAAGVQIVQSSGNTNLDSCAFSFASTKMVQGLTIDATRGVVTVTGNAGNIGEAVTVVLTPTLTADSRGIERWTCTGTPLKLMPGSCRG